MACARGCCATQAEHYKSIVFGTATTRRVTQAFDADMDAYARLRRDGVQPLRVGGAAEVERHANTAAQAEGRPEGTPGHTASIAELQAWEP